MMSSSSSSKQNEDNTNFEKKKESSRCLNRSVSLVDAFFSQRIVDVDWYSAFPNPQFDPGASSSKGLNNHYHEGPKVPVLRIFGATPRGQKTCTHVHGVFPYISILYDNGVENFEQKVAEGINTALNEFLKMSANFNKNNKNGTRRHVFKAVKVIGRTYYGYRHAEELFLRIYFYNPFVIKKVSDLLLTGAVLATKFQPYEAHIPYHLQFLIDYNLYGMNLIHYTAVKFRRPSTEVGSIFSPLSSLKWSGSSGGVSTYWNLSQLPESLFTTSLDKASVCELEIDILASDIITLARSNVRSQNPGIDAIWQDEMERRRQFQGDNYSQLSLPDSQPRIYSDELFTAESSFKEMLINKLKKSGLSSNDQGQKLNLLDKTLDYISASQVLNHHEEISVEDAGEAKKTKIMIQSTDEEEDDDELYNLFKEFMKEKETDNILDFNEDLEDPSIQINEDEEPDEADEIVIEDNQWGQSFLSTSIIGGVLTEEEETEILIDGDGNDKEKSKTVKPIFQGDGQGGSSSESECEKKKKDEKTDTLRKSTRQIKISNKLSESVGTKYRLSSHKKIPADSSIIAAVVKPETKRRRTSAAVTDTKALQSAKNVTKISESTFTKVQPCPRSKKPKSWSPDEINDSSKSNVITTDKDKLLVPKRVVLKNAKISLERIKIPKGNTPWHLTIRSKTKEVSTSHLPIKSDKTLRNLTTRCSKRIKKAALAAEIKETKYLVAPLKIRKIKKTVKVPDIRSSLQNEQEEQEIQKFEQDALQLAATLPLPDEHKKTELPNRCIEAEFESNFSIISSKTASSSSQTDIPLDIGNDTVTNNNKLKIIMHNAEVQTDFENLCCSCLFKNSQPLQLKGTEENIHGEEIATEAPKMSPKNEWHQKTKPPVDITPPKSKTPFDSEISNNISLLASPSVPSSSNYKNMLKKILHKNQPNQSPVISTISPSKKQSPVKESGDQQSPADNDDEKESSFFQIKRSASRSKSRTRRMKIRAKRLKANYIAKDTFRHEFEPLKAAPTFKVVSKFLKQQKSHQSRTEQTQLNIKSHYIFAEDASSQEGTPQRFRKFNVGGSDEEENNSDLDMSNMSIVQNGSSFHNKDCQKTPNSLSHVLTSNVTPKSILRNSQLSARQKGSLGKRRIRWDENSPKVLKSPKSEKNIRNSPIKVASLNLNKSIVMNHSELDGPSPKNNIFGFEHEMFNLQNVKAVIQHQHLTVISIEVHCESREDLLPNPLVDKIQGIFAYVWNDYPDSFSRAQQLERCFLLTNSLKTIECPYSSCLYFQDEIELLEGFLKFFHQWDPDILVGYEIEKSSWGYIIKRGALIGVDMISKLSRILPEKNYGQRRAKEEWDSVICGRIVLNLWRLLRHEITVQSYTYENSAYHVLHRRVPKLEFSTLTEFWNHPAERGRVLDYYAERAKGTVDIMENLDMINRTSELARLFGILFYEVFSRGSQFRVESMMLRVTKAQNLIPVSPSIGQRAKMKAPEFVPLILEPKSNYYTDPVAVLDFQSLYPSMIIGYNYDYATVLGRVEHLGKTGKFELGCIDNEASPTILKKLEENIHISPAGVAFVKPCIRKGVLPEMLEQILDTRQMVKRSMKKWKSNGASLQKILDSRQLGLKLISNVTYGYTSANYSGRMPCVDIADSVVSKGRETLQRAIDYVKSNYDRLGGQVIYGDTDSLFVIFRGKSRREAFALGQQIAEEITQQNPKPVKLKFEKIYQPCILQSKKRYVGFSYETEEQKEPTYDAKGIETVRRDGCPAVKKILEKSLHILFTTNDPNKVKNFVQLQFKKLFTGRVSMKDYTFAREFRGREGYKPGACVPSLEIAKKATLRDPRAEPLRKERVPYVIIYDKPTLPLIQLVRTPLEFANDYTLRLNAHYYIEKAIIPALNRCLALGKMDVSKWYKSLPRKYLQNILKDNKLPQGTLDDFIHRKNCIRCNNLTENGKCGKCDNETQKMTSFLLQLSNELSTKLETACQVCIMCSGEDDKCVNTDCPVFHKLLRYEREEHYNQEIIQKLHALET